jgi:SAM-dependent methyltransferase
LSFDRIARPYAALERLTFGGALQRARVAMLDDARAARRALTIGEGDGRFLRELLRVNSQVQIDCVEGSAEMIALARASIGEEAHRVRFHQIDALAWQPDREGYDLVVTHFFLDCLDAAQLAIMIDKLAALSTPRATWLLADFTIPKGRWPALHAQIWVGALYAMFGVAVGLRTQALVDPTPLLEAHGYRCTKSSQSRFGMLRSASWRRG